VTAGEWTLSARSRDNHLRPWIDAHSSEPAVVETVTEWLARLVNGPLGRGVEERPGVLSARVPGTDVVVIWTLNVERRQVVLAWIGDYVPPR